MYPPLWVRLLRLYGQGQHFPLLRGKSRVAHWAFYRLPKLTEPIHATVKGDIRLELWPWLWGDFCTYMIGSPEPYHLAYFASRVSDQSVVFDVSAYIGIYGLTAARIAQNGRVHAFEPDPRSARRLNLAIESNGIHNLHLYSCAVGNKVDEVQIILQDYPPMTSLRAISTFLEDRTHGAKTISVPSCTLDEHCQATGIRHVDLLKIDVEGAEMLVLQGASRIIAKCRPEMVIELHNTRSCLFGHSVEETISYLHSLGYRLLYILPGMRSARLVSFHPDMLALTARPIVVARPA